MPEPGKPVAEIRDAAVKRETAFNPAAMADVCFYCSKKFGESTPRRVVKSKLGAMLLMHLACADGYERDGTQKPTVEEKPSFGGKNLNFPSFEEMQSFIQARGPIPNGVRITVGEKVIREGSG